MENTEKAKIIKSSIMLALRERLDNISDVDDMFVAINMVLEGELLPMQYALQGVELWSILRLITEYLRIVKEERSETDA